MRAHFQDEEKLLMAARLLMCDCEVQLHKGDPRAAARRLKAARRVLKEHAAPPPELNAELARVTTALDAARGA